MTTFWIVAAALATLAAAFVLVPLLRVPSGNARAATDGELKLAVYRDQLCELNEDKAAGRIGADDYEQARGELEGRLLEELPDGDATAPAPRRHRTVALAAGIAVPLLAALLYLALGNPAALRPQALDAQHGLGEQQIAAMIARLATRLEKNPQDPQGWVLLARAQAVLGRFGEASAAYAKAIAILPDNAQLLADYADALAMAQGRRLTGEPEELIARALRADPNNAKALALAGTVAFDDKDYALALKYWERLRASIPPESEFAGSIQVNIDEARNLLAASGRARKSTAASNGPRLTTGR